MNAELLVLRFIHVVGAIFWVGTVIFNAFFLLPVLKESGPAAAQVMIGLQRRKMLVWLPVVAILTMLAGLRLMMIASNNFSPDYFQTNSGRGFALGGILAIVGFMVGMIVARPSMSRAGDLQSIAVSDEINRDKIKQQIAALQKRAAMSSKVTTWLLVAAGIL